MKFIIPKENDIITLHEELSVEFGINNVDSPLWTRIFGDQFKKHSNIDTKIEYKDITNLDEVIETKDDPDLIEKKFLFCHANMDRVSARRILDRSVFNKFRNKYPGFNPGKNTPLLSKVTYSTSSDPFKLYVPKTYNSKILVVETNESFKTKLGSVSIDSVKEVSGVSITFPVDTKFKVKKFIVNPDKNNIILEITDCPEKRLGPVNDKNAQSILGFIPEKKNQILKINLRLSDIKRMR